MPYVPQRNDGTIDWLIEVKYKSVLSYITVIISNVKEQWITWSAKLVVYLHLTRCFEAISTTKVITIVRSLLCFRALLRRHTRVNHHKFLASALDKDACTSSRPEGFTRANIWCQIWWTPQPNRTLSRREILYASLRKQPKFLGREPHILVNILNEIAVTNTYKYHNSSGREISVGITTCYGQDGLGVESRWGEKIFPTRPDRPWSTPRLLHNRYRAIPGIKQPGRDLNHPQPPSLLTPWCRDLLEQLTGLQLVKKFHAFHGTRRFITALTRVRHLSLSWASPIQSTYPHPTSWRSILILSTHLRLGLSTTTMVARTRLNVTSYVHCLYC
jgi:hypothetical protein